MRKNNKGGIFVNHYSDLEFAKKVGDKPGNVVVFKRILRDKGVIGNRQQLTDVHVPVFLEAKEYKEKNLAVWVDAFETIIISYIIDGKLGVSDTEPQEQNDEMPQLTKELINTLNTLNKTLEKIYSKL